MVGVVSNAYQRARETHMPQHTGRHFLQIPGPTNVPDRVLRAIDQPTIDHRSQEFAQLGKLVSVIDGLLKIPLAFV